MALFFVGTAVCVPSIIHESVMTKTPKNILFLFTDQQRFDTIEAHGNPIIRNVFPDEQLHQTASAVRIPHTVEQAVSRTGDAAAQAAPELRKPVVLLESVPESL